MTRNNLKRYIANQAIKLHYKMHKHRKQWIILPLTALALGSGAVATHAVVPNVATQLGIAGTDQGRVSHAEANPLKNWNQDIANSAADFKLTNPSKTRLLSGHPGAPVGGAIGKYLGNYYSFWTSDPHIKIAYSNAAEYNGDKLGVIATFNGFKHYHPAHINALTPRQHWVAISKDVRKGLFYEDFSSGTVTYRFINERTGQPEKIPQAQLAADSMNGEGYHGGNVNENPWESTDPIANHSAGDSRTGEFTYYHGNSPAYRLHNPGADSINSHSMEGNMRPSNSSVFGPVNTGAFNKVFYDRYSMERKFLINSLVFSMDNSSTQSFTFGSNNGSAWWALSSHGLSKPNPKLHKSTNHQQLSPTKTSTSPWGENYTYTLNGEIPKQDLSKSTKDADFTLTDRLGTSQSDTSQHGHVQTTGNIDTGGLHGDVTNPSQGNDETLKIHLSKDQLNSLKSNTQDGGYKYQIKIPVKYTGQITRTVTTIPNQANEKITKNGKPSQSNTVYNYIRNSNPKIHKTTDHPTLQAPSGGNSNGEDYTYHVNVTVPSSDKGKNASFETGDTLPDNVQLHGSVNTGGLGTAQTSGNSYKIHLDKSQTNADAGKTFTLTIPAKYTGPVATYYHYVYNHAWYKQGNQHPEFSNWVWNRIKKQPTPPPHIPTPKPGNGKVTKKTNHQNITHPGEQYSYTINGRIPKRTWRTDAHSEPSGPKDKHTKYWMTDSHPGDYYKFTDKLPEDVVLDQSKSKLSIPGVHLQYDESTNTVSFRLNAKQMSKLTGSATSNQPVNESGFDRKPATHDHKYHIHLAVKATKLPKMSQAGDDYRNFGGHLNLNEDHADGWYNWYNQAGDSYQAQGETGEDHSKIIRNRIRVLKYHVFHYDFNHNKGGHGDRNKINHKEMPNNDDHSLGSNVNAVPTDTKQHNNNDDSTATGNRDNDDGGNNDQFHGEWGNFHQLINSDGDIVKDDKYNIQDDRNNDDTDPLIETHYGYEGTHVKIPIYHSAFNTYFDENNNERHALYRFGYGNAKDRVTYVRPVLGGFDKTYADDSPKKRGTDEGDLMGSNRPDADESSSFQDDKGEGQADGSGGDSNDSFNNFNDSSARFSMQFWKPYVTPRVQYPPNNKNKGMMRFIVDTDKSGNQLPFRLDVRNRTWTYVNGQFAHDFDGTKMHVTVTDDQDYPLYNNTITFPDARWIHKGFGSYQYLEFKGLLGTKKLHLKPGQKIPLHVDIHYMPNKYNPIQMNGTTTDSHGYISDEYKFNGDSFNKSDGDGNKKSVADHVAPERTIRYGADDNLTGHYDSSQDEPRVQFEEMIMHQLHEHPATFSTGYGIRSDLGPVTYYGILGNKQYGAQNYGENHKESWADGDESTTQHSMWNDSENTYRKDSKYKTPSNQLNYGTKMDFAFPFSFNHDSHIDRSQGNLPYDSNNNDDFDGGVGTSVDHQADTPDRMEHSDQTGSDDFQGANDNNLLKGRNGRSLDTLAGGPGDITPSGVDSDDGFNEFDNMGNGGSNQDWTLGDKGQVKKIDKAFDKSVTNHYIADNDDQGTEVSPGFKEYLVNGHYSTDYKFYPRKLQRDTGDSSLLHDDGASDPMNINNDGKDPLAGNGTNGSSRGGSSLDYLHDQGDLNRLFTPYWLPLSTGNNSENSEYNTIFAKDRPSEDSNDADYHGSNAFGQSVSGKGDKAEQQASMLGNDERLSGNYWNIEVSRPDKAVGHMMNGDIAPADGKRSYKQLTQDQKHAGLSIQPILGGHGYHGKMAQHVRGFSKSSNDWVKFVNDWKNLF